MRASRASGGAEAAVKQIDSQRHLENLIGKFFVSTTYLPIGP